MSTKHLFKLKKDGKTVGYMQLQKHNKPNEHIGFLWRYSRDCKHRWTGQKARWPIFNSAHPFVTKDKNGKDVFAGDKVKAGNWYFEVIWQKYGYGLKGKKSGWWRQFHEFEGIELIEEEQ